MIQRWNASNLQQNKLVPDIRFLYSINSKATTKLNKAINRILLTKMVYRIWPGDRFWNTQRHNQLHNSRRKQCIGYGLETGFGTHKDTITHKPSQKKVYRIWPGDMFRNTQRHNHTHTHSRRKRCIGYGPETGFGTHNAQSHSRRKR